MNVHFLTTHARVLLAIVRMPGCRLRQIAEAVGLTERATHRLVDELVQAGCVTRHRIGNRSLYEVHADYPLGEDDAPGGVTVGDFLRPLLRRESQTAPG
jgi:hypothetical protein